MTYSVVAYWERRDAVGIAVFSVALGLEGCGFHCSRGAEASIDHVYCGNRC